MSYTVWLRKRGDKEEGMGRDGHSFGQRDLGSFQLWMSLRRSYIGKCEG